MPTGKTKMGSRPPGCREVVMNYTEEYFLEIRETRSLKEVVDRGSSLDIFVENNIREVRDVFLKKICELQDICSFHADWAEGCITRLREVGDSECYWKKILEWYLFAAEDSNWRDEDALILRRAIGFALSLCPGEEGLVSKLLAGRLKKGTFSSDIYDKMPALKSFFHRLLRKVYWKEQPWKGRAVLRTGELWDEIWHHAVRAIEIAVLTDDFNVVGDIDTIMFLMEKNIIRPGQYAHWSTKDTRIAYLKAAKECLEEAREKAAGAKLEEEME
jgi:hypothetical protein